MPHCKNHRGQIHNTETCELLRKSSLSPLQCCGLWVNLVILDDTTCIVDKNLRLQSCQQRPISQIQSQSQVLILTTKVGDETMMHHPKKNGLSAQSCRIWQLKSQEDEIGLLGWRYWRVFATDFLMILFEKEPQKPCKVFVHRDNSCHLRADNSTL